MISIKNLLIVSSILLFTSCSLFWKQKIKKNQQPIEPYKESYFDNNFIGGAFNMETAPKKIITAHMKRKISKKQNYTEMDYVTYHDGRNIADTLKYIIDFKTKEKASWIYYDRQYRQESDSYELQIDTFDLVYQESIEFTYDTTAYKIWKYEANPTDNICITHYFSDTLGLIKKYHPQTGIKGNSVELDLILNNPIYNFCKAFYKAIKENDNFHTRCDGKPRWIQNELLDKEK